MIQSKEMNSDQEQQPKIKNLVYICPSDHLGETICVKGWYTGRHPHSRPIILIHDIDGSSEELVDFATELAKSHTNVYTYDVKGFTKKTKKHFKSISQIVLNLLQVASWVRHKEQGISPVLVGYGAGCLIALQFSQMYEKFCGGCILIQPPVAKDVESYKTKKFFIKKMADWFPHLSLNFTSVLEHQSKSKKLPAIAAHQVVKASSELKKNLISSHTPILIFISTRLFPFFNETFGKSLTKNGSKNVTIEELPMEIFSKKELSVIFFKIKNNIFSWMENSF